MGASTMGTKDERHTIVVSHESGDRFAIGIREHEVVVDQPLSDGGTDSGPSPTELFVASLASCIAFYARRFLARHKLPETLSVTATWDFAQSPTRVGSIEISVDAPSMPADLYPRFERVIGHCTVHNSIENPPIVAIRTSVPGARGKAG